MLDLPFEKLLLKKQYRVKGKDKKVKLRGYDTETVNGVCTLLACSDDFIHPRSFDTILEFLTRKRNRGTLGFFYNLRYDFQSILKWLSTDHWIEIHQTGKTQYGDYTLTYIPKKLFSIQRWVNRKKKKTRRFSFYDIAQYYKGMTLDMAAKKYLKKQKKEHGKDIAHLTEQDCYDPKVIEYCKYDAKLCEELAVLFLETCWKTGLYPTTFCSTASISGKYFLKECDIPNLNPLMKTNSGRAKIHAAWLAYSGAYITVFKRGYFRKVYEYDLNSAYPYAMTQLPNIEDGSFFFQKGPPPDLPLGWLRVIAKITPDHYGYYHPPFPILRPGLPNFMPSGQFLSYITLAEYNAYKHEYDLQPDMGLYWFPKASKVRYPFRDAVLHLYRERQDTDDPNLNYFYKICLNAFYGKNLERTLIRDPNHDDYGKFTTGNFFNPFYASYIVALTRIQVFKALRALTWGGLIGCFTDSVLTTEKLPLPLSKELGEWQISEQGELLMVGCGVYSMRGQKLKTKVRGFHTTSRIDLFDIFKSMPDTDTIKLKVKHNVSPITALIQKRPKEMNLIETVDREVHINFDSKRLWKGSFKCAKEMFEKNIDSLPIDYDIMTKILRKED